ncbi:hypothetical protein [Actinoplanes sp. N902-109]|uniref:hypothetical protein n=1 Tax=Actinoplanes sp. (strain N902-109) TaxID=649831 RepID=UPI000329569F|nr:hypothetical protein [Actinoplanes sp. N902-109]AGL15595.1 hypothetical protein L083_2085 [Actinoplanes sp. N902-109]
MAAEDRGFAAASRAVVAAAADLLAGVERTVVGAANVRTARGNAYAATRADRDRARARADMDALVAALAAAPRPRNNRPRAATR